MQSMTNFVKKQVEQKQFFVTQSICSHSEFGEVGFKKVDEGLLPVMGNLPFQEDTVFLRAVILYAFPEPERMIVLDVPLTTPLRDMSHGLDRLKGNWVTSSDGPEPG